MGDDQREPINILEQKKLLRKEIRAKTRALDVDSIATQSSQVWQRIFALPIYKSAKSIGLFLSMPSGEINTDEILKDAIKEGKDIYVPQVGQNFEKCDMDLLKVVLDDSMKPDEKEEFHKHWPKNKWMIPEPPADMPILPSKPGDIDLLIVPGLGFDRFGGRIGQGKGYYDRFIARMNSGDAPMPLVAVALTSQLVEGQIPVSAHDQKMDIVVFPEEVIEAKGL
mmetsp:Transcript_34873/g.84416  ORF Transcript_34873/g.84416 Transcript_34873/m.84416 type:complete len:224 (+) Transcript_34873:219-890(+)|eukprot:CAMPEP_0113627948 /NCGR_PEP_ID=MMETSP0017_2-20120614/14476_1 /TAXON_ID=2856 /ORGANISM="Cylindrotheca closterium" /LENGTH=223 /DNA_ID=CAMNT_0000538225 /DNA_START=219 /DNA_END=890 /DNA_ORIENTATION=+ /assembly_acc=CAM_ASM_000147